MSDYDTKPTLETLLEEMRKGFAAIAVRFDEIEAKIDLIDAKIDTLNDRLLTLEGKVRLSLKRINDLEMSQ